MSRRCSTPRETSDPRRSARDRATCSSARRLRPECHPWLGPHSRIASSVSWPPRDVADLRARRPSGCTPQTEPACRSNVKPSP
jgi:hypothetical protein